MVRRKFVASLAFGVLCCVAAQDDNCTAEWLIFDCEQPPPVAVPCAADAQRTWVVETSAQAQDLAAAINCSGGSFEVEWRGAVVVDEPIYVADGTVLTVNGSASNGASSEAVIDGNSATRLFTVVDATLHISGVNISSGVGIVGGAMAAAGSALTLDRTSFVGNSATEAGGAVYVSGGSRVAFVGDDMFADNRAGSHGGALYATGDSVVSWTGEVQFLNNSCTGLGGALAVESSTVVATGSAKFVANSATGGLGYGGAMNAFSGSSVVLSGEATLFQDNFAGHSGGAVTVAGSEMSWSGSCQFAGNNASETGGALIMASSSTVSWDGPTGFLGNAATSGGAIYSNPGSSLSWSGKSVLSHNYASDNGGAIFLETSSASWAGDTEFSRNTAENWGGAMAVSSSTIVSTGNTTLVSNSALTIDSGFGGAVNAFDGSSVIWSGEITHVQDNSAGVGGGGMAVARSSEMSFTGPCRFSGNTARTGGGMTVSSSRVSWSADTTFAANFAQSGGALFVYNGSNVTWTGFTEFRSNEARFDGGAIGSPMSGVAYSPLDSKLAIHGTTSFANNTCGGNGGAVALLGGCTLEVGTVDVAFSSNTADVAGGALFVSAFGLGPTFSKTSFVSNSALVGGAVSTVGSGNTRDALEVEAENPTTFDGCLFINNTATTAGGAIESAAGQDAYIGSLFEGNQAGAGGALRLAGTASVDKCSFVENISGDGGGAAVSNIGFISNMANVSFSGNAFDCQPGTFLDFKVSRDVFCVRHGVVVILISQAWKLLAASIAVPRMFVLRVSGRTAQLSNRGPHSSL